MAEYRVIIEANLDEPVICALIAHGTTVEIAVNRHHSALALAHVAYHLEHGVDRIQLCSLQRDCGYTPTLGAYGQDVGWPTVPPVRPEPAGRRCGHRSSG